MQYVFTRGGAAHVAVFLFAGHRRRPGGTSILHIRNLKKLVWNVADVPVDRRLQLAWRITVCALCTERGESSPPALKALVAWNQFGLACVLPFRGCGVDVEGVEHRTERLIPIPDPPPGPGHRLRRHSNPKIGGSKAQATITNGIEPSLHLMAPRHRCLLIHRNCKVEGGLLEKIV
jgi:hypothetical protein